MSKKLIIVLSIFIVSIINFIYADNLDPYLTTINQSFSNINKENNPTLETFLRNMPKGADLHNHMAGAAYPEWLLRYIREDKSPNNFWCTGPSFGYVARNVNSATACGIPNVLLKDLKPGSADYNEIVKQWSMAGFDYESKLGHDHFFTAFGKIRDLNEYYQTEVLADLIHQASTEHLNYLELMVKTDKSEGNSKSYAESITAFTNNPNNISYSQVVAAINELEGKNFTQNVVKGMIIPNGRNMITKSRNMLGCNKSNKSSECDVLVKLIYPAKRTDTFKEVFTGLYAGFTAAKLAPDVFVGVNLVAPEDGDLALRDYNLHMQLIQYFELYYNSSIKVTLHAGELSNQLKAIESRQADLTFHINNAVATGYASRIGHGVDFFSELNSHSSLSQTMQESRNVVEINLTSNEQILGVCDGKSYCVAPADPYLPPKNYKYNHPFYYYLASNIPTVLSTDNQGIEQITITTEYYKAATRYKLTYAQLKNLDRNSLTFSFLPGGELWAKAGQYSSFVSQCSQDNPYTETTPSATCQSYLNINMKAQMQWNLERQFAIFEGNLGLYYIPTNFTGPNYSFNTPVDAVSDKSGNIWITNYNGNTIIKLPANSPNNPIIYSGANYGFNGPWKLAIDNSDNLWVTNVSGNSVTKIPVNNPNSPTIYSGANYKFNGPWGIAADNTGNIWVANILGNSVTEIPVNSPTNPINFSGQNYYFNQPANITIDIANNIWISSQGNVVTEITAAPNSSSPFVYTGANYGFNYSLGIVADIKGNIWVTNYNSNTVTEMPAGNPTKPIIYSDPKYGFNKPFQVRTDSIGNIWVANQLGNSVTKIPANNPNNPIVYSGTSYMFNQPTGIASDNKGNIWVVNFVGNSVTELVASLNP